MPVFHTKTIESILEPVANQVSQLIVIHDQLGEGQYIIAHNLADNVKNVSAAVNNLVQAGKDTVEKSKDEIFRREMPPTFNKVGQASNELVESTELLTEDVQSKRGQSLLITGARGILNGTSALLLTFDDHEVRKILIKCRNVLDYIPVAEVVESLPDTVTYIKNLSPGLLQMAKAVDNRIPDLTHVTHAELLQKHVASVKELATNLPNSMRAYISASQKNRGRAEAQENRNFIVGKMCDDIIEIMRVLQLKVDDEYDLEDPTNLMRKAQHRMTEKMKLAKEWLANPDGEANGLGERALRDIIKQARQVGMLANDQQIKDLCDNLDGLVDRLSALRAQGLGNSPEALSLAKEIDGKLEVLAKLVNDAIKREVAAGSRLPAATTSAQFDQAMNWLEDPRYVPNSVGKRAIEALLADGKRLAESMSGAERQELLKTIGNIERLTKQLEDLKRAGKGHTPEAQRIAAELQEELERLKSILQRGAVRGVVDNFKDILSPVKQLAKAAKAPADAPNREQEFEEKAGAFEYHTSKMVDSAEQTAIHGKHATKQLVDNIHTATKELAELTPQVSHAGKLLLLNPGDKVIDANFDMLKGKWENKAEEVMGLVDAATDAADFVKATEEALRKEQAEAYVGLEKENPAIVVAKGGNMARMGNRVTQVANAEAENSEDPEFRNAVSTAAIGVSDSIKPLVASTKNVAMNPKHQPIHIEFKQTSDGLIGRVVDVKNALAPPPPREPTPPPPPPPEEPIDFEVPDISDIKLQDEGPARPAPPVVEGIINADESRELHSMLEQTPDSDNRMAFAAHQLHVEANRWEEDGNELIQLARQMALLFAKMSKFITDEEYFMTQPKKMLIDTARQIARVSAEFAGKAMEISRQCPDKRMKHDLNLTIDRIPTISTQLKILATVKATMFGANDPQADFEATEMLVGCAENLMGSARSVVKDCEAASIKIRTGAGKVQRWKRDNTALYSYQLDKRY